MKFAKYVFTIAGVYGLLVSIPPFFLETKIGIDYPSPITNPEYYYGFFGTVLAWQVLFLIIGRDPIRFRAAMLPAIIEKAVFAVAVPILYSQGRTGTTLLYFSFVDLALGILFVISYWKTPYRQYTHEV
ncbi:MAG: hypothetical protein ACHQQQ_12675 [Bacteroidota bacterium]